MRELVALDLPAGPAFVDMLRRAWDDGDAVLPLQQEAPPALRRATATRLGATVVVDDGGRTRIDGGWPVERGDAVVVATSGSTGEPKGAVHTHRGVESAAHATAAASGIAPDVHWLACLPLSHVGGLSVVTRALLTGATLTVHPGFDAGAVDRAAVEGATHVSLVPTALGRVDTTAWRRILVGGSAMPSALPRNCTATYGMTESFGGMVYDGLALGGTQVRIAGTGPDETDRSGPIELRSASLLRCYRDGTDPVGADGWYRTGDIGRISSGDRRLVVEGRADALIVTGGEKVWPEAVERVLEAHPAVAEAAVLGRADPEWGQRVTAMVVPAASAEAPSLAELRAWAGERLARAAAPKELLVVGTLPRTPLGKLRRGNLDDIASGATGAASGGPGIATGGAPREPVGRDAGNDDAGPASGVGDDRG